MLLTVIVHFNILVFTLNQVGLVSCFNIQCLIYTQPCLTLKNCLHFPSKGLCVLCDFHNKQYYNSDFIMDTQCIGCEVQTELLHIIFINFKSPKG